jgi:hypothetical protein
LFHVVSICVVSPLGMTTHGQIIMVGGIIEKPKH